MSYGLHINHREPQLFELEPARMAIDDSAEYSVRGQAGTFYASKQLRRVPQFFTHGAGAVVARRGSDNLELARDHALSGRSPWRRMADK